VRAQQASASSAQGHTDDFGSAERGGRGQSYVAAQRLTQTRSRGICALIDLIERHGRAESPILVDLLGGNGLVRQVVSARVSPRPVVVTCDASPFMIEQAWSGGIPALLQRADRRALGLASDIFRYPDPMGSVPEVSARPDQDRAQWSMVMPREALVIVGRKPGGCAASR
jgi:hypothetical protein